MKCWNDDQKRKEDLLLYDIYAPKPFGEIVSICLKSLFAVGFFYVLYKLFS